MRLIQTGDERLWLAIGAVAGVGFLVKHTVIFWGVAIVGGLLLTPMYVVLFAAGGVSLEHSLGLPRHWRRAVVAVVGSGIATAYLVLPVVPASSFEGLVDPEGQQGGGLDARGPELVDTVAAVTAHLSPDERATAVIYTANYGEAAALEVLGDGRRLPPVISEHNACWLWGYGSAGRGTAIAVGLSRGHLETLFTDVREVAASPTPTP